MKLLLVFLLFSYTLNIFASNLNKLDELARKEPLSAVIKIKELKNSDEKFSLMYLAESQIASKSRTGYYYQGKINPKAWDNKSANKFDKYVFGNISHFNSGSEGMYSTTANDFWIKKIKDRKHPMVAFYEYSGIKSFDNAVWDDGDGSMHTPKLKKDYLSWIKKHPSNELVNTIKERIKTLEAYDERHRKRKK
jgi:hypothetical protein